MLSGALSLFISMVLEQNASGHSADGNWLDLTRYALPRGTAFLDKSMSLML